MTELEQNVLTILKELTDGAIDVCANLADAYKEPAVVENLVWNDACATIADAIRDLKNGPSDKGGLRDA